MTLINVPGTRALAGALFLVYPLSAQALELEVELSPAAVLSAPATGYPPGGSFAAAGRARLGVDFGVLSVSLDAFGVSSGSDVPRHAGQQDGLVAWALVPMARYKLYRAGAHQVTVGLGVGVGRLVSAQSSGEDLASYQGDPGLSLQATLGYRYLIGRLAFGVESGLLTFHHINFYSDVGGGPNGNSPTGKTGLIGALLLTLAWRSPSLD